MEGATKKNPKKVETGKKEYQARLLTRKEEILAKDSTATIAGTTATTTATVDGATVTTTATNAGTGATTSGSRTKFITTDVYMYGVGSLTIVVVCITQVQMVFQMLCLHTNLTRNYFMKRDVYRTTALSMSI